MMFHNNNPGNNALTQAGRRLVYMAGLSLLLFLSGLAQGAQIRVETDRGDVAADENFQIVFSVEGDVDGEPDFSVLNKDFELLGTSQSRSVSIVNGKTSRTTRYLVNVLPRRGGELTIPPVRFGSDKSPQVKVLVKDSAAQGRSSATGADASVFLEVFADEETPYVQQQVMLTVRIFSSISWREASLSEPEFEGGEVLVQKLGEDSRYQKQRAGKNWQVIERRYALFPQQSGEIRMQALNLRLRIPAGRKKRRSAFGGGGFNDPFFDDFFSNQSYRNKVVRSKPIALQVKPVPADYSGGQWLIARDIRLEESWSDDLDKLKTGEPVTRTLAIVADGVTLGQLPDLEMVEIDGLRIYPDEPVAREQATGAGILSTSSRKFAIIPVRSGDYRIPAIALKWWNSETDREEVARIPPRMIKVAGSARVAAPPAPVAPESVTEKPSGKTGPVQEALSPAVSPAADTDKWLLAGAVLFLALWLITLVLFLRQKQRASASSREESEAMPAVAANAKAAWKTLHESVEKGDAAEMRKALLKLAPVVWPEQPPRSLEAMAQRVGEPLSGELQNLSRVLYAGEKIAWDGLRIEEGMKALHGAIGKKKDGKKQEVLRPMYPELKGNTGDI